MKKEYLYVFTPTIIFVSILSLLLISGCVSDKHLIKYVEHDNTTCYEFIGGFCGIDLHDCDNDATYKCVQDVKIKEKWVEES